MAGMSDAWLTELFGEGSGQAKYGNNTRPLHEYVRPPV